MNIKPIESRKMYKEVVSQISLLLEGGELKPGDKLLPDRELASRLQVSRNSVRDAIRLFEMMGLVDIRPGDGTFIRARKIADTIQPLAMFRAVDKSSLFDMLEIRKIFEASTAALAAERATVDDLVRLESALDNMIMSCNVRDSKKGEEYDIAFHRTIARATHNNLLIGLFSTISGDFSRAISTARQRIYLDDHNPVKIIDQHLSIYYAIKSHYPENASLAMIEHLNFVQGEVTRTLGNMIKAD